MAGAGTGSGSRSPHGMSAYERISVVGKGSFGTVSKVRRRSDNRVRCERTESGYGRPVTTVSFSLRSPDLGLEGTELRPHA